MDKHIHVMSMTNIYIHIYNFLHFVYLAGLFVLCNYLIVPDCILAGFISLYFIMHKKKNMAAVQYITVINILVPDNTGTLYHHKSTFLYIPKS